MRRGRFNKLTRTALTGVLSCPRKTLGQLKAAFLLLLLLTALTVSAAYAAVYVPTIRDTGMPAPPVEYETVEIQTGDTVNDFILLGEAGHLKFYYREDRDLFAVTDSRNGYTWKTGIDVPFNQDIDRAVSDAETDEEEIAAAVPKERDMNATFIAMANSLLTVEYYDDAFNINRLSSASRQGAESSMGKVKGEENHYILNINFTEIDLGVKVHVYLTAEGLRYKILDSDLTGAGTDVLGALILTPFLGASGGMQDIFNPETMSYDIVRRKPMIPGSIMIPDGPGALIRFRENNVAFRPYVGAVYGENLADAQTNGSEQLNMIPAKVPLAPVFGITHGDRQAAFVSWADGGAEHLEITVSPEGNITKYYFAYPRFVYNRTIYQQYNQAGTGYMRLYPERNRFDADITYSFLSGNGETDGLPADYTGMALKYREHLLETGQLTEKTFDENMNLHLDFVMNDVKKDIWGTKDMVVTTADDVRNILTDLTDSGVTNINAGLLGAQSGGIMGGKPWKLSYKGGIGSKGDFRDLLADMAARGTDVYFTQDYATINRLQMLLNANMAYHRSNWGLNRHINFEFSSVPVTEVSIARPQKSAQWMTEQTDEMKEIGASSVGIDGITSRLTSHYGGEPMDAGQVIELMSGTVENLGMTVNSYNPNMYLWNATDRFINAPMVSTQYIIETDTVPFLQMVLNGTMELYAPYANFSFYNQSDILRMIDFNVFPSFVLTEQPAYLLADTNSSAFYSTSYDIYRELILNMYNEISGIYESIAGRAWTGRDVLANGVVLNSYEGGLKVLINYTEQAFTYEGFTAEPLAAAVIEVN